MKKILFAIFVLFSFPALAWTTQADFLAHYNVNPRGASASYAVTTASSQIIASQIATNTLFIFNPSATVTVWCNLGGTASANTGGSFAIQPLNSISFTMQNTPLDALNCIAASATNLTIMAW